MKKRGITLISISIVVVVLTVLTGIITVSTSGIIRDTYKKEFFREYQIVQTATDDYIMRNSGIIDFEEITVDLNEISYKFISQFSEEELSGSKQVDMYIIDLEKIGVKNSTYGIEAVDNDVYVISQDTNIVYYLKGFEQDGYIYYVGKSD